MHSSRLSLFYPILILGQWIVEDYELTYKFIAALFVGIFSVQVFRVSNSLSGNDDLARLAACYTVFSPQLTYFGSQYSKNLLGVVLFLWLFQYISKSHYLKAGILLVINFFGHKLTAGISVIALLAQLFLKKIERRHLILIGSVIGTIVVILSALPVIFGADDLKREGMGLTTVFHWPSWTYINTFGELLSGVWKIDVVFCNLLFLHPVSS